MDFEQEPPFCLQVELTEGCPLRCSYCGINAIHGKKRFYKFMTVDLAEIIANKLSKSGWNCRVEFAMHGEPTMNPNRNHIVSIFRKYLPEHHLTMLSNGIGLCKGDIKGNVTALFEAGLNCLAIEEYEHCSAHKIIKRHFDKYISYPNNPAGNPHKRIKKERLIFMEDIKFSSKGTHSELCNHCGDGGPLDFSRQKEPCAKPFREMGICWDGVVPSCCNDFQRRIIIGMIQDSSFEEIWQSRVFQLIRKKLYHGERSFVPCLGCNYRSYRNGLLPDKKGLYYLPNITIDEGIELNDYRFKRD
jgi:MoaA/NifB/PqqE/SkfB family radical SAM enzyme